jgi:hypothetical protein
LKGQLQQRFFMSQEIEKKTGTEIDSHMVLHCKFIWPSTFTIIMNLNANILNGHTFNSYNPESAC